AHAFGPERERQRGERLRLVQLDARGMAAFEHRLQRARLELGLEDFALGLLQQQVARVVAPQHVEEQAAGGLQLAQAAQRAAWQRGRQEAGHARDLAELAPRQLAQVGTVAQVVEQLRRVE